jgi:hypothetical protein
VWKRRKKEGINKELQTTGGIQSCAQPDPFIEILVSLLPHVNFDSSSEFSLKNFVLGDVINVVGFGEYELHGLI